jgi:hypothetical protein
MNFEDQLQNALNIDNAAIDETQFIGRLHATQHQLELQQARFQSSMATAVLLLIFGWASYAQLNDTIFDMGDEVYYSYEDNYDYFSEIDSSDYDLYVADMALYLLDEDDVWDVLEFFEEEYEYAFNTKEIKL